MTNQSPIRYVAVTTIDGDKFIIRVSRETPTGIFGVEVDRDGEEVVPPGMNAEGRKYHSRTRVFPRDSIKKVVEMRMNVVYCRIERAK